MASERYVLQVHVGAFSALYEALSIQASKETSADEIVSCVVEKLELKHPVNYELAEVVGDDSGQDCKERRVGSQEFPAALQLLWPRHSHSQHAPQYRFCLREKFTEYSGKGQPWPDNTDPQLIRDYFLRFLYQPREKEYTDLCQLPDLTEQTLLENLKSRFEKGHIYTYVGSILIAVNPFRFFPIYNPKYVKLYQNRRLGDLPPHIFAIADGAYQTMLRDRTNQCIVISGESGSGKTESTNLLLHHLTALSQKGTRGSGIEQTILSAGPVLEAFGNAKTKHNNNSSRFGKFIQVNYNENGVVHGALVQNYLLEKSRIVCQAKNERNYHVFYYLLAGATDQERTQLHLMKPDQYSYLNQSESYMLEGVDEAHEYSRLRQSMEMVGFGKDRQLRLLGILSAVLHLGNVEFSKKSTHHSDEAVAIKNSQVVSLISQLLGVKEETLSIALTCKRAKARSDILVINYKMPEAIATRDAMAKCLYGALFDWIVVQVNRALLCKRDVKEHKGNSISVLDIFGFEDFGEQNSFEQFCINIANERLHYYFNQHVFKYEQEEYQREGIQWKNVEFIDNTACLEMIESRPNGLLCLLDDQCSFPGASNSTLLQKFEHHHKNNEYYEMPSRRENAFLLRHYAGIVKYQIKDFREKNLDLMRPDVVTLLKSSRLLLVRELVGGDPVALFRWAILRTFFRAFIAFVRIGKKQRLMNGKKDVPKQMANQQQKRKSFSDNYSCKMCKVSCSQCRKPASGIQRYELNCTIGCGHCCPLHSLGPLLNNSDTRVLERANQILLKRKPSRPMNNDRLLKELRLVKALVGRGHQRSARKQPSTVSAQFQASLNQLMEALNNANPFFVRCIKSNSEKVPNFFDDAVVLQQLRYTGMLETVHIRQSGYSVRLTFEEFIQQFRILLPKGLLSSRVDISLFLGKLDLNHNNYQMGKNKVFLRESEKLRLDECLHLTIMQHIITLQRWIRTLLARRHFVRLKEAAILIQAHIRSYLAQRRLSHLSSERKAAACIQSAWRAYKTRCRYLKLMSGLVGFQSAIRGYLARQRFQAMWVQYRKQVVTTLQQEQTLKHFQDLLQLQGFLAGNTLPVMPHFRPISGSKEGESGICDDSDIESLPSEPGSIASPMVSPALSKSKKPDAFVYRRSNSQQEDRQHLESFGDWGLRDISYLKEKKHVRGKAAKSLKPFTKKEKLDMNSEDSAGDDGLPAEENANKSSLRLASESTQYESSHHKLKNASTFHKGDFCSVCNKHMSSSIFNQGYKCTACKLLFHGKCVEMAHQVLCRTHRRRKARKPSKASELGSWSVTRTAEFKDSKDIIITDVQELKRMDEFISRKIYQMNDSSSGKKSKKGSAVDVVFKNVLQHFKSTLISTYSVAAQAGRLSLCYKDLIDHFEQVMLSICQQDNTSQTFPLTMGLNAFRGFLDEFRNLYRNEEKPKSKGKKRKRKKPDYCMEHLGHKFFSVVVNIPTVCEICSSFMWMMEKSLVCDGCKLTCHRRCSSKVSIDCRFSMYLNDKKVFGAPVETLVSEECPIPAVVDKLITIIEMRGLYTEGIYRKSGTASKVKELRQALEEGSTSVNIDDYNVHVLTTVLKSFFREMPEPLMTFELYDDFLRDAELSEHKERLQAIYTHIHKLPRHNFDLLERLVFHLARVSQRESANRMSPGGLAIIFAPCILRTNKNLQAQDSLNDISRQTMCLQTILEDKLLHIQSTLADIDILDTACLSASWRLTNSKVRSSLDEKRNGTTSARDCDLQEEEADLLNRHISTLQTEKQHLTILLPSLRATHSGSDEELLGTDADSAEGSVDDIFNSNQDLASVFDKPVCPPSDLKHLTKCRAGAPKRRLPARFVTSSQSNKADDSVVSLYQLPGKEPITV